VFGDVELNATGYNIFYDVGNHFNGTLSPATSVISVDNGNNICVADMFERADNFVTLYPRINLSNKDSIGFVNGKYIEIGPNVIEAAPLILLTNNSTGTVYTFDSAVTRSTTINYSIVRDTGVRHGSFRVVPAGNGVLTFDDDYVENENVGVTLLAQQTGDTVDINYTTTNTGLDGSITFSVSNFRL
jgi:hypothetical protein